MVSYNATDSTGEEGGGAVVVVVVVVVVEVVVVVVVVVSLEELTGGVEGESDEGVDEGVVFSVVEDVEVLLEVLDVDLEVLLDVDQNGFLRVVVVVLEVDLEVLLDVEVLMVVSVWVDDISDTGFEVVADEVSCIPFSASVEEISEEDSGWSE